MAGELAGLSLPDLFEVLRRSKARRKTESLEEKLGGTRQALGQAMDILGVNSAPTDASFDASDPDDVTRRGGIAARRRELVEQGMSPQQAIAQMARSGEIDPRLAKMLLRVPNAMDDTGL